jgi:hypothetical protein
MIDANYLLFATEGTLQPGATRVWRARPLRPLQRHRRPSRAAGARGALPHALLEMSYADPDVRPLLDLEGLKAWREGRVEGYGVLEAAVDAWASTTTMDGSPPTLSILRSWASPGRPPADRALRGIPVGARSGSGAGRRTSAFTWRRGAAPRDTSGCHPRPGAASIVGRARSWD